MLDDWRVPYNSKISRESAGFWRSLMNIYAMQVKERQPMVVYILMSGEDPKQKGKKAKRIHF